MKKLILSTFAMSLILLSNMGFAQTEAIDDFLGLENEIFPELKGSQRFTSKDLHDMSEWNVKSNEVEIDLPSPNLGQKYSIIPWHNIDTENFLSIDQWIAERKIKDVVPDWKIRLRQSEHSELVGKVLRCKGVCGVYRGTKKNSIEYLSQIREGDEVVTDKDSIAWIFLLDGSLARLSPETSISFHEFNISRTDFFIQARLNNGHIFWSNRNNSEVIPDYSAETDSISLPLMIREANRQYYERKLYSSQDDRAHLTEFMNFEESAVKAQVAELNRLKAKNNLSLNFKTKFMLVSPNATLISKNATFDFSYSLGGKSYLKKRTSFAEDEFHLYLRGYSAPEVVKIVDNDWHEVSAPGREHNKLENISGTLQILELLSKRIQTIELAREFWIQEITIPLLKSTASPMQLAKDYGHTLWGEELNKRLEYLIEYTRRIETTNLMAVDRLVAKLEAKGEKMTRELSEEHFRVSLNHYLLGLKSRYDKKKLQVREMDDLNYYVWILKDGKF